MSKTVFQGEVVGLEEMMLARETRSFRQLSLLQDYEGKALLCATMNIPGPIKTSDLLQQAFQSMLALVKEDLLGHILFEQLWLEKTGYEYYLVSDLPAKELKSKMMTIETSAPLGRLMDLDVLQLVQGLPSPLSRRDLGASSRSCYICQEDAKACGRSRKHSIEEMQNAISEIIQKNL